MLEESEVIGRMEELKGKLIRAQRQIASLKEKSKYLEMQYDDSKVREKNANDLVMELLERQRELNVMLNRANIMVSRTQEVIALTSVEFNEMAKALPEPKKVEWSDRISKINELFKKTGIPDAELPEPGDSEQSDAESLDTDELKQESEKAFGWKDSIWKRKDRRVPPEVEATPVEDEPVTVAAAVSEPEEIVVPAESREVTVGGNGEHSGKDDLARLMFPARPKSWWRR